MDWLTPKRILWTSIITSIYFVFVHLILPVLTKNGITALILPFLVVQLFLLVLANYRLSIEKLRKDKLLLITSIVILSMAVYFNMANYFIS